MGARDRSLCGRPHTAPKEPWARAVLVMPPESTQCSLERKGGGSRRKHLTHTTRWTSGSASWRWAMWMAQAWYDGWRQHCTSVVFSPNPWPSQWWENIRHIPTEGHSTEHLTSPPQNYWGIKNRRVWDTGSAQRSLKGRDDQTSCGSWWDPGTERGH